MTTSPKGSLPVPLLLSALCRKPGPSSRPRGLW